MKLFNLLKNENTKIQVATNAVNSYESAITSGISGDMIIESGTSGSWRYKKFASGVSECWATLSYTMNTWAEWGSVVEAKPLAKWSYPTGLFISPPFVQVTGSDATGAVGLCCELWTEGTALTTPLIDVIRPKPAPGSNTYTLTVYVYARGKWANGNILCRPYYSELPQNNFSNSAVTINYKYSSDLAKADNGYFEFTCTGSGAGAWTYTFVKDVPYTGPCELITNIQSMDSGSGVAGIYVSVKDGDSSVVYSTSAAFPGGTTGRSVTPVTYVPTTPNATVTVTLSPQSSFSTSNNKSFIALKRLLSW